MSGLTRRRFLTAAGLVTIGLVAGAVGWRRRELVEWLAHPALDASPAGPLGDRTEAALMAAAHALLDDRITDGIYLDFFRWRAQNLPGHRSLYERFRSAVDASAHRVGAKDFASAPVEDRRRILQAMSVERRWTRLTRGIVGRDDSRYSQHIVREIFRLFARTDAWVRTGYESFAGWPRSAEGLDALPKVIA